MTQRALSIELADSILRAARRQALDEGRSLASYIEELIARDLGLPVPDAGINVANAAGISQFVPDREAGESDSDYERRKALTDDLLALGSSDKEQTQ